MTAPPTASRALRWQLGLILALGVVVIYRHVGGFSFIAFDDDRNILFNPHLGPLSLERVRWAFGDWEYARRSMPLGWLGFAAVFSFSGLNPTGYHLAGVALQVVNSLLFFTLLRRFANAAGPESRWSLVAAFLGTLFWAWHPLRVESVAWASGLLYGEAECFLLLALVIYVPSPEAPRTRLFALLAYGASLLSYPLAIGFAPVFALVAAWRMRDVRRGCGSALPFFVPAMAAAAINLFARLTSDAVFIPVPTLAQLPLAVRAMQAAFTWVYYAWIPFWTVDLTLYNPVLIDFDPWSAGLVASAVVLSIAVLACLAWPRARRTAGPFLLAHLCVLVPMMGWVERPYFPSDRYAAFAQGVMAVALLFALLRLDSTRRRGIALALGAVAGIILVRLSAEQTLAWRDTPTVYAHSTRAMPPQEYPVMHFERPAEQLYLGGDMAGAIALYDRGLALLPHDRSLLAGRASLLRRWTALQALLARIGAPPSTPPVALLQEQLGVDCARAGELAAAAEHLRLAGEAAPGYYSPPYNLALVQLRQGRTRAALQSYLCAEGFAGRHLSAATRQRTLGLIADQFAAAGETEIAAEVRARAVKAGRD